MKRSAAQPGGQPPLFDNDHRGCHGCKISGYRRVNDGKGLGAAVTCCLINEL